MLYYLKIKFFFISDYGKIVECIRLVKRKNKYYNIEGNIILRTFCRI